MKPEDIKNASTETLDKLAWDAKTPADVLAELAKKRNESIRKGVAWNPNTPADVLAKLANETSANVRTYVAMNKNTPVDTLSMLTNDVDAYTAQKAAETLKTIDGTQS